METSKKLVGNKGEQLACERLTALGHIILERNWRWSHLEVDIITLLKNEIHFVEVKTRTGSADAVPEERVDYRKRRRLVRAAEAFLHSSRKTLGGNDFDICFDVFSVIFEGDKVELRYLPQAFIPIYC